MYVLFKELANSADGYWMSGVFTGASRYANNLKLLTLSANALNLHNQK